jgi:very-short-patch-repair endonuclease
MFEGKVLPPHGSEIASTPDFYFPDKKIAVYCDSAMHHRGERARLKDEQVSDRVKALGIKPVRVWGPDIVKNLDKAVESVLAQLN